jgi:protoheme IX farnesyltransferase
MSVTALHLTTHRLRQFYELAKPRVVSLIVFCAVIGMFLAVPAGSWIRLDVLLAATVGIALVAGAAAAVNCLVEQKIDAVMARTPESQARNFGAPRTDKPA